MFYTVENKIPVFVHGGKEIQQVGRDQNTLLIHVKYQVVGGDMHDILLLCRDFMDVCVAVFRNVEGRTQMCVARCLVVDKGHGIVVGGKRVFTQFVWKQQ